MAEKDCDKFMRIKEAPALTQCLDTDLSFDLQIKNQTGALLEHVHFVGIVE
jgi:hypothetical protein